MMHIYESNKYRSIIYRISQNQRNDIYKKEMNFISNALSFRFIRVLYVYIVVIAIYTNKYCLN